jgi:hypothetical protein
MNHTATTLLLLTLLLSCACYRPRDIHDRLSCRAGETLVDGECLADGGPATVPPAENPDTPDEPAPDMELSITRPSDQYTSYPADYEVMFQASFTGLPEDVDTNPVTLTWSSSTQGLLHTHTPTEDGEVSFSTSTLNNGTHSITLVATQGEDTLASATVFIGICGWDMLEDFDAPLDQTLWKTYHNATQDPRGWLELTGNAIGKKGHMFNIGHALSAGQVRLAFDISTGQCDTIGYCNSGGCGADGFAASVYNVSSVEELDRLVTSAQNGGGLGYNDPGDTGVESFHIEFDTYHNGYDPISNDHIAIHLDSDSHNEVFFASTPDLEDNHWHQVILSIDGTHIKVHLDNEEIIQGTIPDYNFKGGLIGFSGTTGACTNFHRIDNLRHQPHCSFD